MKGRFEENLGVWATSAAAGLTALGLALLPEAANLLRYQREAILGGEVWRLLTGQFVHLGLGHLGMNLAALGLITSLFQGTFRSLEWLGLWTASVAGTAAGLLMFEPGLQWYVGLSGALHGLFAGGSLRFVREGEGSGWVLAGALAAKLAWEQLAGPLPGSEVLTTGRVITAAHFYGALGGAMFALARVHRGLQ